MANTAWILGLGAAALYLTRNSWLPAIEGSTATAAASGTPTANSSAPGLTTGSNSAIGPSVPGAVEIAPGVFVYSNGTLDTTDQVTTTSPGTNPPITTPAPNNCGAGYTLDAAGICTLYPDAYLIANFNTIPWTGLSDIPTEQISRIDPQLLSTYASTTGVNAGTALAYILGLGGASTNGTMVTGSDGNTYQYNNGVFFRQGTATTQTSQALGRLGRLQNLAAALPITTATLVMASSDPHIAALVGNDPRAMLTSAQWDYYYTQASGVIQALPTPTTDPNQLITAQQYQANRRSAGLQTTQRIASIRTARRGAFPLGRIGTITQWVPPGNRTIYQIPGRGAVPAGPGGVAPPARRRALGLIHSGGGDHRWARSPFPRPAWWREAD